MICAAGTESLGVYEAYPLGPNRRQVFQTACFPPETIASPDFAEKSVAYLERLDAALDEDIPALENQQLGLQAADAPLGRLQPVLEANVAAFAHWCAAV